MEQKFIHFFPSRIHLIGEHIDYVGGKVVPIAIDIGIKAYVCKSNNIQIKSTNLSKPEKNIIIKSTI